MYVLYIQPEIRKVIIVCINDLGFQGQPSKSCNLFNCFEISDLRNVRIDTKTHPPPPLGVRGLIRFYVVFHFGKSIPVYVKLLNSCSKLLLSRVGAGNVSMLVMWAPHQKLWKRTGCVAEPSECRCSYNTSANRHNILKISDLVDSVNEKNQKSAFHYNKPSFKEFIYTIYRLMRSTNFEIYVRQII